MRERRGRERMIEKGGKEKEGREGWREKGVGEVRRK